MSTAAAAVPPLSMGALWRVVAADFVRLVSFSMVFPVIAVALTARGESASVVGAVALMPFLGILLVSGAVPTLRARLGAVGMVRVSMGLSLAAMLAFALTEGTAAWLAAAFLGGLAAGVEWTTVDSLVAETPPREKVGRVTGLFQTLVGLGFAAGPAIPAVFTLDTRTALWTCVVLELVAWLPTLTLSARRPVPPSVASGDKRSKGLLAVVLAAPAVAAAGVLGGLFENGMNALSTVQATHLGFGAHQAVLMPSAMAVGSLLVQYPVGRLAERVAPVRLMGLGVGVLVASAGALAFSPALPWIIWPVALSWGAVGGSLYTLTMIHVGTVFRHGGGVPAATAAAVTFYTAGALIGPAVSGPAMDASPDFGLAAALGGCSVVALAVIARGRRR